MNAQQIIADSLNQALALSPDAIKEIFSTEIECTRELLEQHPTIAVACHEEDGEEFYTVSVMSILNSVMESLGHGKVAAVFETCDECPGDCSGCDCGEDELKEFVPYP